MQADIICQFGKVIITGLALTLLTGCANYHYSPSSYDLNSPYPEPTYNFPTSREATGKKVFIFDPAHTSYALYDKEGYLVKQGRASGGKHFCPDINKACRTPSGNYTIFRKKGADCKSSKYPIGEGGAPMPHCMFFKGGYAIHGSHHVPNYNASHGCIRVPPSDAAWLSQEHLDVGDTVIIRPYYQKRSFWDSDDDNRDEENHQYNEHSQNVIDVYFQDDRTT